MHISTSFSWHRLPALRLLLPFAAGIVSATMTDIVWLEQWGLPLPTSWLATLAVALLGFIFWVNFRPLSASFRQEWLIGVAATALFFSLGYSITVAQTAILNPDHFSRIAADSSFVLLRLDEQPVAGEKSYKTIAQVVAVLSDSTWVSCSGKAILYFEPDSAAKQLRYGDMVITNAPLRQVAAPKNPNEFDYGYYLRQQNIWHQAYLGSIFWRYTGINRASRFRATIFQMRNYCLNAIKKYVGDDEYGGVAAALLIGYTHLLEDDVRQIYSQTGVTHVLAVSGMHVGILAAMFSYVFSFMRRRGKWAMGLYHLLIIIVIWQFTFVTGATPSVIRAAVMFTLLLGGLIFGRKAINYNVIAASAMGILIFEPNVLFHVGFQLSYAAVLGIVMFQRPIQSIVQSDNKAVQTVWEVMSVTLAAQVLTVPLTLYYFHQFPVFFLLANVFAVPLSALILYGGVLLLVLSLLGDWVSPLTILAQYCGNVVWWLIWLLNKGLYVLGQLPGASWQGFAPTKMGVVLMFAIIALLVQFLRTAYPAYLRTALLLSIVALFGNALKQYAQCQQRGINIYAIKNGVGIDYTDGKTAVFVGDSVGMQTDKQQYHIQPYRYVNGIRVAEQVPLSALLSKTNPTHHSLGEHLYLNGNMAQFYDRTLLICDTVLAKQQANSDIEVDYLLLTQNPPVNLQQLSECVHFKHVVIDASNSRWRITRWEAECGVLGISYRNIKDEGALLINLNATSQF